MAEFTKEQLIARVKQATAINRRRINANPDATGLVMDNELFAIALAALSAEPHQEYRAVGVMSETAFHRLESRAARFIALWPRPGILVVRKRPDDGVLVYAKVEG